MYLESGFIHVLETIYEIMQFVLHWIKIKLYAIFLHVGHENLVLNAEKVLLPFLCLLKPSSPTTAHLWYDSHSTNINACRM